MKKIFLAILLQLSVQALFSQIHCGTERWSVKTLSDPDTVKIDFNQVVTSSVHLQTGLTAPHPIKDIPRRADESTVYQITCRVLGFKKEGGATGDKDFHVVIEDPETHETMIAEIPSEECDGVAGTSRAEQFAELRQWFSDNIGEPTVNFHKLKDPVTVILTGVGFFDYNHGQTGRANNGREIHPVLTMDFASAPPVTAFIKPQTTTTFSETNSNTPNSSLTMTPIPIHNTLSDFLLVILLASILGMAGQVVRLMVGLKKANQNAAANPDGTKKSTIDLINGKQLAVSLFIAIAVGAVAGVLAAVNNIGITQLDKSTIFVFLAAGYAGTDLIEGFIINRTK